MEDFAPLFWVLLTVAAMVYSGVSKARKQAAKAAKQVPAPADEAWPRMDDAEPDQALPADSEGAETGSAATEPAGTAGTRVLSASGSGDRRDAAGSRASAARGFASGSATSRRTSWAGETSSAFGDSEDGEAAYAGEAQSLEEIPSDVFRPGAFGADYKAMYGMGSEPAHQAAPGPQRGTRSDRKASARATAKTPSGGEIGSEDADVTPNGQETLGEEFDLRKAVIYSEILKPKFEE